MAKLPFFPREFIDSKDSIFYILFGGLSIFYNFKSWGSYQFKATKLQTTLFIGLILSCFLSSCTYESLISLSKLVIWLSITYSFIKMSKTEIKCFQIAALITNLIIIGIAIITFNYFPYYKQNIIFPIGHLSIFAHLISLSIPLTFIVLKSHKYKYCNYFAFAISFLLLLAIIWSSSRTALVSILIAIVFLIFNKSYITKKFYLAGGLVFIIIIISLFFLPENFFFRANRHYFFNFSTLNDFFSQRINIWQNSLKMFLEKPIFGLGIGSFRYNYLAFDSTYNYTHKNLWMMHPHNELIHKIVEFGLIGISMLAYLFIILFYKISSGLKYSDSNKKHLLILYISGLIIIFIDWQGSTNYLSAISKLYFAFYLGVTLKFTSKITRPPLIRSKNFKFIYINTIFLACFLIVSSYQISLIFVRLVQNQQFNLRKKINYAKTAQILAPRGLTQLLTLSRLQERSPLKKSIYTKYLYDSFPNIPIVQFQMALYYLKSNKNQSAIDALEKAISMYPEYEEAKNLLRIVKQYESKRQNN